MQKVIGPIALVGVVGGIFYYIHSLPFISPLNDGPPASPGWDELNDCTDVSSIDDKKSLTLSRDGTARLGDSSGQDHMVWHDGNWSLDDASIHTYTVNVIGAEGTYTPVSPINGQGCILAWGSDSEANLRLSWYSVPQDNTPEPDSGP